MRSWMDLTRFRTDMRSVLRCRGVLNALLGKPRYVLGPRAQARTELVRPFFLSLAIWLLGLLLHANRFSRICASGRFLIQRRLQFVDGAAEVGDGPELLDELHRRAHRVERRNLEDARIVQPDHAL